MQFGFTRDKETMTTFVIGHAVNGKKFCFGLVDMSKAFDRVPSEVMRWNMYVLGVDHRVVSAVTVCRCRNICQNSA